MEEYVTFYFIKKKYCYWHEREKIGIMYGNVSRFRVIDQGFIFSVTVNLMLGFFCTVIKARIYSVEIP